MITNGLAHGDLVDIRHRFPSKIYQIAEEWPIALAIEPDGAVIRCLRCETVIARGRDTKDAARTWLWGQIQSELLAHLYSGHGINPDGSTT